MLPPALPCTFFRFQFFFRECTSTQVRMAELPGNSQKPLAFGAICPAAFLLLFIRKKWGWMQSTSSPFNVMRLCNLGLLSFTSHVCSCSSSLFISFSSRSFFVHALCMYMRKLTFKNLLKTHAWLTRLIGAIVTVFMYMWKKSRGREELNALESGFTLAG